MIAASKPCGQSAWRKLKSKRFHSSIRLTIKLGWRLIDWYYLKRARLLYVPKRAELSGVELDLFLYCISAAGHHNNTIHSTVRFNCASKDAERNLEWNLHVHSTVLRAMQTEINQALQGVDGLFQSTAKRSHSLIGHTQVTNIIIEMQLRARLSLYSTSTVCIEVLAPKKWLRNVAEVAEAEGRQSYAVCNTLQSWRARRILHQKPAYQLARAGRWSGTMDHGMYRGMNDEVLARRFSDLTQRRYWAVSHLDKSPSVHWSRNTGGIRN